MERKLRQVMSSQSTGEKHIVIKNCAQSTERFTSIGVPRGPTLGSVNFSLFSTIFLAVRQIRRLSLMHITKKVHCENLMFLQNDALNLHLWCDENKMKFIVSKMNFSDILQSIETKSVPACILIGDDNSITPEEVKDLGIEFESLSNWPSLSNERFQNTHIRWIPLKAVYQNSSFHKNCRVFVSYIHP